MPREYNCEMKKKVVPKKKQAKSSSTDDIKRYLGALAEDFQGRVSAVAEQFSGVNEKLNGISRELGGVHHELGGINKRLDGMDGRFDGIDKKLDTHTQMIGQLMVDVQEIKGDMKQKVERSEFSRLEKRVIALELRPRATAQRK